MAERWPIPILVFGDLDPIVLRAPSVEMCEGFRDHIALVELRTEGGRGLSDAHFECLRRDRALMVGFLRDVRRNRIALGPYGRMPLSEQEEGAMR